MLVKLDGVFCNEAWNIHFDNHVLHSLSTSLLDHYPLLLSNSSGPRKPRTFLFENFWIKIPSFKEVVLNAWPANSHHTEPIHRLNHMAMKVILCLDIAQESRHLSPQEFGFRAGLKKRVMGLAVLERSRKRQNYRISNLR